MSCVTCVHKANACFARGRSPSPHSDFISEPGPSGELVRRTREERAAGTTTREERAAGTTAREERAAGTTAREERAAASPTREERAAASTIREERAAASTTEDVGETVTGGRGRSMRKVARINTTEGLEDEVSEEREEDEREDEAILLARHPMRLTSDSEEEAEERGATQESPTREEGDGSRERPSKRSCSRPARYRL